MGRGEGREGTPREGVWKHVLRRTVSGRGELLFKGKVALMTMTASRWLLSMA